MDIGGKGKTQLLIDTGASFSIIQVGSLIPGLPLVNNQSVNIKGLFGQGRSHWEQSPER